MAVQRRTELTYVFPARGACCRARGTSATRGGPPIFAVLPDGFAANVPPVSHSEDAGGSRQLDPVRPWQVRRLAVPAAGQAAVPAPEAAAPAEQAQEDVAELRGRVEQLEAEGTRLATELAASQARNRRIEHELARATASRAADRAAADRERAEADGERSAERTERDRLRAELAGVRQALASAEARIGEITAGHAAECAIGRASAQRELGDACRRAEDAERTLAEAVELIETERSRALAASREQAARLAAAEQRAQRAEQRAEAMRHEVLEELAAERARMRAELGVIGPADG